jgi:putative transposase
MPTSHHADALRRGRCSHPGHVYLLTFTTRGRWRAFDDWDLACAVSRTLSGREAWLDSRLLCWVLMPDHWHGLLQLGVTESLSRSVGRARATATRACGRTLGRPLALWQRDFHDHALRRDEDLRSTARYIIANPLRAGLVDRIGDYPFWDAVWLGAPA